MESDLLNRVGLNRLIKICLIAIGTLVIGLIVVFFIHTTKSKEMMFKNTPSAVIIRQEFTPKCVDEGLVIYEATIYYKAHGSHYIVRYYFTCKAFNVETIRIVEQIKLEY